MLNRFNGKVEPFAIDATGTNRTIFGDVTQSDDIDDNLNADFLKGWEIVGVNDNPTKQDFNALAYTLGNLISYLYQQGLATWNTTQEYFVNSYVVGSDGKLYRAKTGTSGTPNQGNDPTTDSTNWENLDGKFVDLLNAQTIAGIKTFSSFPVTPSSAPTTNYQTANKKYVDDSLATLSNILNFNDFFHAQDQKTSGTSGGSASAGTNNRDLNTVIRNNISGVSLSSNEVILPVGNYYIEFEATVYAVGDNRAEIRNITDSIDLLSGVQGFASGVNTVGNRHFVNGFIEISGSSKNIAGQSYCSAAKTTDGLGRALSSSVEVYSDMKIWKLS